MRTRLVDGKEMQLRVFFFATNRETHMSKRIRVLLSLAFLVLTVFTIAVCANGGGGNDNQGNNLNFKAMDLTE